MGAEIKLVITSDPTSYKNRIGGKEEREYDGDNDDIAEAWFLHDDPDTKNYIPILEHNADVVSCGARINPCGAYDT